VPLNSHTYEVQNNGISSLEVNAWIGTEAHPEFIQKSIIDLSNAPKELEIELKVGDQKIRFKPQ
jgi:hypothetical protein